ncbi:hypothetical protein BV133_2811 [Blastochloris viridis]|uniref:Uncharacterized protein n=1 Tax=Blastochloris viridis TaxID=1079 RepID=A0A182D4R4_BLAVI|nr:hypothetical protein BV133_2811 [Blastochloris viridis]
MGTSGTLNAWDAKGVRVSSAFAILYEPTYAFVFPIIEPFN